MALLNMKRILPPGVNFCCPQAEAQHHLKQAVCAANSIPEIPPPDLAASLSKAEQCIGDAQSMQRAQPSLVPAEGSEGPMLSCTPEHNEMFDDVGMLERGV